MRESIQHFVHSYLASMNLRFVQKSSDKIETFETNWRQWQRLVGLVTAPVCAVHAHIMCAHTISPAGRLYLYSLQTCHKSAIQHTNAIHQAKQFRKSFSGALCTCYSLAMHKLWFNHGLHQMEIGFEINGSNWLNCLRLAASGER